MEWLLVVWILTGPGGVALSQVGPFADEAACKSAGVALDRAWPSMRYLCVARSSS